MAAVANTNNCRILYCYCCCCYCPYCLQYFWSHSDGLLIPSAAAASQVYAAAVGCITQHEKAGNHTAVLLYSYDFLSAVKTSVVVAVQWDSYIPHYWADCDFYYRVKHSGALIDNCNIGEIINSPGLLNSSIKAIVLHRHTNHTFQQRQQLAHDAFSTIGSYSWRDIDDNNSSSSRMSEADRRGHAIGDAGGHQYLAEKYHDNVGCQIHESWGNKPPNFDIVPIAP